MSADHREPDHSEHLQVHHSQPPQILRPLPRRPFELNLTPATSSSSGNSHPSTPPSANPQHSDAFSAQLDARLRSNDVADRDSDVKRSRSILNLTASTLFGIYQPTGGEDGSSAPQTPWGTGAETPARFDAEHNRGGLEWEQLRLSGLGGRGGARSPALPPSRLASFSAPGASSVEKAVEQQQRPSSSGSNTGSQYGGGHKTLGLAARAAALFVFGVAYGVIISHLHDNKNVAPVRVEGINRNHWSYLVFWGLAGVGLGSALPWVDLFWEGDNAATAAIAAAAPAGKSGRKRVNSLNRAREEGKDWNEVVRSVGAFVGIAFAIRKLPWQSTLQVSLTLALVNPALWYLLDRSKPGFTLSMLITLAGTTVMLLLGQHADNLAFLPSPPTIIAGNSSMRFQPTRAGGSGNLGAGFGADNGYESVGVATWFASVLFCSCICFGNIGRKLAIQG